MATQARVGLDVRDFLMVSAQYLGVSPGSTDVIQNAHPLPRDDTGDGPALGDHDTEMLASSTRSQTARQSH